MTWPQPFWAVLLAILGVILALAVLFHPDPISIGTAVLAVSSNLVSGALGAFAGHSSASNSTGPNATINNPGAVFPDGDSAK